MSKSSVTRRDFSKLTLAALGGATAALAAGCESGDKGSSRSGSGDAVSMLADTHVCRGLNACRGKGAGGGNACAGQGACATAKAHACKGENECKGQGGCGEKPGLNACKGQGACAVPLNDKAWAKARASFEGQMKAAGRAVGAAPVK